MFNVSYYKSCGPLRSHNVSFDLCINEETVINIVLNHEHSIENKSGVIDVSVKHYVRPLYNFFNNIKNDVLLNNIYIETVLSWIEKIESYNKWLTDVYIPKWGYLDEFFYQVYLWVKEDLKEFALYSGLSLVECIYDQRGEDGEFINKNYPHTVVNKII